MTMLLTHEHLTDVLTIVLLTSKDRLEYTHKHISWFIPNKGLGPIISNSPLPHFFVNRFKYNICHLENSSLNMYLFPEIKLLWTLTVHNLPKYPAENSNAIGL